MIQCDQEAIGHPQQPHQVRPWGVRKVPYMAHVYTLFLNEKSI